MSNKKTGLLKRILDKSFDRGMRSLPIAAPIVFGGLGYLANQYYPSFFSNDCNCQLCSMNDYAVPAIFSVFSSGMGFISRNIYLAGKEDKARDEQIKLAEKERLELEAKKVEAKALEKKQRIDSKIYLLEDAFEWGKTQLEFNDEPKDFVRIDYTFSTDCDSESGTNLSFCPGSADKNISFFIPRRILPNQNLETRRYHPNFSNQWIYSRMEQANASFFIAKKDLVRARGSLEKAIAEIPTDVKLTATSSNGYTYCCYGKVYLRVGSADGKTFDYKLKNAIARTKPVEQNLPHLRELYAELGGKEEIIAYLDRRIAAINAEVGNRNFPLSMHSMEFLADKDNLKYAHPCLIKQLTGIDKQVDDLVFNRNNELNTLCEVYGKSLTEETLTSMRTMIIAKYDPQIAKFSEEKHNLAQPLKEVKAAIARLGSRDIRTMPREDYEIVNRAYRTLNSKCKSNPEISE